MPRKRSNPIGKRSGKKRLSAKRRRQRGKRKHKKQMHVQMDRSMESFEVQQDNSEDDSYVLVLPDDLTLGYFEKFV